MTLGASERFGKTGKLFPKRTNQGKSASFIPLGNELTVWAQESVRRIRATNQPRYRHDGPTSAPRCRARGGAAALRGCA
jgi:hypothetical protein